MGFFICITYVINGCDKGLMTAIWPDLLKPLTQTLGVDGQFVTHAISANMAWEINNYLSLGLSYSHFFAGLEITEAGGHDSDYVRTQLNIVF